MSQTATPEILTLAIEARGEVISSNFPAFAEMVRARLSEINRNLVTDDDFDQADSDAKAIAAAEASLKAAKEKALADAEQLHELFSQIDGLAGDLSKARLDLGKQITKRKADRKAELLKEAEALLICAPRHRKGYEALLVNAIAGKKSFDNMAKALETTVKSYNALIEKSRGQIDSFVTAHGPELVMDREDLEIKSPEAVEAELRRRFEAKRAADEQKRLQQEAAKAKAEIAAMKQETAAPDRPAAPANVVPMVPPAPPKPGAPKAPPQPAAQPVEDDEWDAFAKKVLEAFAPLRAAREALTVQANKDRAEAFAQSVGAAWGIANKKEVAK